MNTDSAFLKQVQNVRTNVATACAKSGRHPNDVRIIAVTKTVGPEVIGPLLDSGIVDMGENRWQHARELVQAPRGEEAVWHFIGHLQTNKVKYVASHFNWCHSIDSLHLAEALSQACVARNLVLQCLIQVNVAQEASKSGVPPEMVMDLLQASGRLPGLHVRGLMTMAPKVDHPEQTRPVFRELRNLLQDARKRLQDPALTELSMGMSDDYEVAVEEGATMIRIGRHLMASFDGYILTNGEPER